MYVYIYIYIYVYIYIYIYIFLYIRIYVFISQLLTLSIANIYLNKYILLHNKMADCYIFTQKSSLFLLTAVHYIHLCVCVCVECTSDSC